MRKKTEIERRATAAARQARWRQQNRRTHRERVQEQYGRARAQGFFLSGVTPEEVVRYAKWVEKQACRKPVTDNVYAEEEGVDAGYVETEPNKRGAGDEIRGAGREAGDFLGVKGSAREAGGVLRSGALPAIERSVTQRGDENHSSANPGDRTEGKTREEREVDRRLKELLAKRKKRAGVAVELVI